MRIDLSGKKAVISGSTAGIGFGIARGLAAAGADVVITGRERDRVDEALANLALAFPDINVEGVAADLGTADGCQALIAAHPQADILVNNVGIFKPTPFFEIEDQDWETFFQVNVMSAVRLSRHYAQGMRDRDWGRVLFLSSEDRKSVA